jgi:hypothetical protein
MSTTFLGGDNLSFISGGAGGGGGTSPITLIKTCSIPTGVTIVDSTIKLGNNSVFYNYTLYDCTNFVSGTIVLVWNSSTNEISFNNTSTMPIGSIPIDEFLVDNLGDFIVDNLGNYIIVAVGVAISFEIVANSVNMVLTTNNSDWKINLSKIVFEDCCSSPYISEAIITTEDGLDLITENNDILITQ